MLDGMDLPPPFGISPRIPPINYMAERSVLGALICNNKAMDRCAFLRPDQFGDPINGAVFKVIRAQIDAGRFVDPITLQASFENTGDLDEIGGTKYISELVGQTVAIINVTEYAKVIRDNWMRRQLIDAGEILVNDALGISPDTDPTKIATDAVARIDAIAIGDGTLRNSVTTLDNAMDAAIEAIEAARTRQGPAGISTGFTCIDNRLGGLEPGLVYVIGGRPGMGKAQPLDAKILLEDGSWATMGSLRVGQRIASVDGAISRVAAIFPRGQREVFRVTLSDGRSTSACAEHLWRVNYRDWSAPRILNTSEISRMLGYARYKGRLSIERVSGHFGQAKLPIDPYVLGALLGDGCLLGRTPRISSADTELITEIQYRLGLLCKVARKVGSYNHSITSGGRSRRSDGSFESAAWLPDALSALGLGNTGSGNKFVPAQYMTADRRDRLDVLRGLMDTDGWVEKHGSVRFTSCSRVLAENVRDLVRSLGGVCSIVEKQTSFIYKGIKAAGKVAFMCRIRHEHAEEFFLLKRKSDLAIRGKNAKVSLSVVSVEPCGIADTRCIRVTHPSSLYVTDEYIVTHNSSFGHSIALNAAQSGVGVLEISLEMSAMQLGRRALSTAAGVPLFAMKSGRLTNDQAERLIRARRELAGLPLTIDDAGGQTPAMIAAKARAAKRKHGLGLLMIDHLNLMKAEEADAKHGGTWATGRASNTVLQIAKDCGCPVLLLAQLNRGPENRDDKRPTLADLRQAGDIEQDAYAVGFVYRPEYYLGGEPEAKDGEGPAKLAERRAAWQDRKDACAGIAEVIWQKVRDGEPGTDQMRFHGPTTTFSEFGDRRD